MRLFETVHLCKYSVCMCGRVLQQVASVAYVSSSGVAWHQMGSLSEEQLRSLMSPREALRGDVKGPRLLYM